MKKPNKPAKRSSKPAKAGAAKVLGVTKDGVRILKPRLKATHFSDAEVRRAVTSAKAAKRA